MDGISFFDEDGFDKVIFNYATWLEVVKAVIVKYAGRTYQDATNLVFNSPITNICPTDFMGVFLLSHEIEYHWAMLIAHGEGYWKKGVSSEIPDGYFEWDRSYRAEHGLAKESFVWLGS